MDVLVIHLFTGMLCVFAAAAPNDKIVSEMVVEVLKLESEKTNSKLGGIGSFNLQCYVHLRLCVRFLLILEWKCSSFHFLVQ